MKNVERHIPPEMEKSSVLIDLWKNYSFPGMAPARGTIAEERLYETCTEYARVVRLRQAGQARSYEDIDPENYHSPEVVKTRMAEQTEGSDREQRRLHNQIAIMVFGESRDTMKDSLAMKLKNFALEFANAAPHKNNTDMP